MKQDIHAKSNLVIAAMLAKEEAESKTIKLTKEQAEFLGVAMNWWKTSGVNPWSAVLAESIEKKLA